MSTRCRIGIQNQDGSITSIYCHHDGYPDRVGDTLANYYTEENKIKKLMELGDMSSLGNEPVDNPKAWETPGLCDNWFEKYRELHPEDMCDTYKSRGEDVPAQTHPNLKEYQKYSRDCWGEYAYLFKDGEWYVLEYDDTELKLVKDLL